jgi:RNA polymerase sigma factor (sigma-70 family)
MTEPKIEPSSESGGPPTDSELASRVARGDRQAETLLIERYTGSVLAVVRRRLERSELAQDLAQEAFLIAFEHMREKGIHDPGRVSDFLRLTAIDLAIGEQRKYSRLRSESDRFDALYLADDEVSGSRERAELRQLVLHLIHSMPVERDRDLLWRYYVQGEDKESLCAVFKLTVDHFDRVLHRARRRLRELVEKTELAENRHVPPRSETQGIGRLISIAEELFRTSTSEEAERISAKDWLNNWMQIPQPALGHRRPIEVVNLPDGMAQVAQVLGSFKSGVYL